MCELPKLFESRIVTGRKLYHCCECLKPISRGERHQYVKGIWGGDWSTYRTCIDCSEILTEIYREWDSKDCGIPYGYLFEWDKYIPDAEQWLAQRKSNIKRMKGIE